jgi:hypothetical protein
MHAIRQKSRPVARALRKRDARRAVEQVHSVIPGRAEGANPESSHIEFFRVSGFRIATPWRPE